MAEGQAEDQRAMLFANRDFWGLFLASLVFFALVAVAVREEVAPQWRQLQRRYIEMLRARGGEAAVRGFDPGVRQIWLPRLGRVDRCVTCHVNADHAGRDDLPPPFAPHPALALMERHRPSTFGCTPCHGGQGYATELDDAHGEVPHWDEPLVTQARAASYGLTRGEMMEMHCNACHRRDAATPGMDLLNLGKRVVSEGPCVACHVVEGEGGLGGPDLTYAGDKSAELLDFSRIVGARTALNWHIQHFEDPQAVSPESAMPNPGFSRREALAVALLVLSWREQRFPPDYIPSAPAPAPAALPIVREIRQPPLPPRPSEDVKRGWELFQQRGCHICHSVGEGMRLGPDLLGVSVRRSEDWLRSWLSDPAAMIRARPELQDWPRQYSDVIMPNQNLSGKEIALLVAYLETL